MSTPLKPQRHFHEHECSRNETESPSHSEPTLDLGPLPQLGECTSSEPDADFSTGNTPSTRTSDSDSYSPPMSTELLPGHPSSPGLKKLIGWLDSISNPQTPTNKLPSRRDFSSWKAFLFGVHSDHSELCSALIHAIEGIGSLQLQRSLEGVDIASDADEGSAGFSTGMPLIVVPWEDVGLAKLGRMSTMAVRSGLLQACTVLHRLHAAIVAAKESPCDVDVANG